MLFLALVFGGIAVGVSVHDERSALPIGFIIGYFGYAAGTVVFGVSMVVSSSEPANMIAAEFVGVLFVAFAVGVVAGAVTGAFAALVPLARRRSRARSHT